ncbi:MAG: hypothetical protein RLN88_12960 [Ekhidna sp.]|uniref:hypothetical protein n=1 Tax=Ekhidna sp. TaxID=2608089 RepID=UPI0032EDA470
MNEIEKMIDQALKTEPSFQLRKDFKDRVVSMIRRKEKASQRRLYFWMSLGTLVIFGFGYAAISYFMPSLFQSLRGASDGVSQLVPLAVLIGVILTVIQFLDKRLVKDKMMI